MRGKPELLAMLASALLLGGALAARAHAAGKEDPYQHDQRFVERIVLISMAEVDAGRIAATRAQSQQLRELSAMTVSEYGWTALDLRAMARYKGLEIPQSLDQARRNHIAMLASLDSTEFDQAYVRSLMHDYSEAIGACEIALDDAQDPDLRRLAEQVLPALRLHLQSVQTLALSQPRRALPLRPAPARPAPSDTSRKRSPPKGTRRA